MPRISKIERMQADTLDQLMELRQDIDIQGEPVDPPAAYCPLSPAEREQVARIILAEAGAVDIEGMTAVAQVIRDRAMRWNMTVEEVISAPGQFAKPYEGDAPPEVYAVIDDVFVWGVSIMEVPTTHFHAEDVSPYWTEGKTSRGGFGGNRFWY